LTDFLHSFNDGLSGFEPIGAVNRTHVHTSQDNIVPFPGLSSWSDQIAWQKHGPRKNKACPETGFNLPTIAVCGAFLALGNRRFFGVHFLA
jgi:hypothetical protein